MIAAVTVLSKRTALAFKIGGTHVIEDKRSVPEVTPRYLPLDTRLLGAKAVQGSIDLALLASPTR